VWIVSSVLSLRYHRMAVFVGNREYRVDCIISVIVEISLRCSICGAYRISCGLYHQYYG
jgi:hypothetical protein